MHLGSRRVAKKSTEFPPKKDKNVIYQTLFFLFFHLFYGKKYEKASFFVKRYLIFCQLCLGVIWGPGTP